MASGGISKGGFVVESVAASVKITDFFWANRSIFLALTRWSDFDFSESLLFLHGALGLGSIGFILIF